jgi:hypothetical protein
MFWWILFMAADSLIGGEPSLERRVGGTGDLSGISELSMSISSS